MHLLYIYYILFIVFYLLYLKYYCYKRNIHYNGLHIHKVVMLQCRSRQSGRLFQNILFCYHALTNYDNIITTNYNLLSIQHFT